MSKLASLLGGNAALVGGGAVVIGVALVASGVLKQPEPVEPTKPAPAVAVAPSAPEPKPEPEVAPESKAEAPSAPAPATPTETTEAPSPQESAPAAEEATAEAETTPAEVDEAAAPILPAFDVVRVDGEGNTVIAGRAASGALIGILLDGDEVAQASADEAGKFASILLIEPSPQPRVLTLVQRREEGDLFSDASFIIAPVIPTPAAPTAPDVDETPVVVAEAEAPAAPETAEAAEETAPEQVAETDMVQSDVEETAPKRAPAVLVADEGGVRVVQPAAPETDAPEVLQAVSIDGISYSETGDVAVSGRGQANKFVRLYLDNDLADEAAISTAGQWQVLLTDVDPGLYQMRVDEVDETGKVMSRVEIPFQRETQEKVLAALAPKAEAEPEAETEAPAANESGATEPEQTAEAVTDQPQETASTQTANAKPADTADAEPQETAESVPAATPDPEPRQTAEAASTQAASEEVASSDSTVVVAAEAETSGETVQAVPTPTPAPAPEQPAEPEPAAPSVKLVTVQPGFTLWAIATEHYGSGVHFVHVHEANKDQIRDPDLIYPGQIFEVPVRD
ncbi:LysM peptidoglycan-binding domain-containing protein [Shimia sp. W99]